MKVIMAILMFGIAGCGVDPAPASAEIATESAELQASHDPAKPNQSYNPSSCERVGGYCLERTYCADIGGENLGICASPTYQNAVCCWY